MAKRHVKRCSISLIIREVQFETTIRCHLTSVRMAIIKKQQTPSFGKDVAKREPSYSVGGIENWCATMINGTQFPQKIKNRTDI